MRIFQSSHIISSNPLDLHLLDSTPVQTITNIFPMSGSGQTGTPLTGSFQTPWFAVEHLYGVTCTVQTQNTVSGSTTASGSIQLLGANSPGRKGVSDTLIPPFTMSSSYGGPSGIVLNDQEVVDAVLLTNVFTGASIAATVTGSYANGPSTVLLQAPQLFTRYVALKYTHFSGSMFMDSWLFGKGNRE